ncbi:response regulator [Deinococcus alpinitundrae]|uniref:response regulator n=1 Tax=Deinococcus alpinitundrae TaxID=468913 RepID=UPI00137B4815|nr:response regulator transcription factor [Deinococcus alpinitundrae]
MRLLLADDQTLVRQGLLRLLSLADDIEVVAEVADGLAALEMARQLQPDILLLDVRMPHLDGLGVLRTLRLEGNEVAVVLLSTFSDETSALSGLRLGAHSYLLKDVHFDDLLLTLRAAVAGERLIYSGVARHLSQAATPGPDLNLTVREQAVLRLMAGGYSNKQIALALNLQEGTIKNHVSSILLKLEVHDRTRAVLSALALGLL